MNIYLLFNSDIVNFVLKTDGVGEGGMGVEVQKAFSILVFKIYLPSTTIYKGSSFQRRPKEANLNRPNKNMIQIEL